PPTTSRGTDECGTPHQLCSGYRGTPRQNLSCPDRFRSDNEKTPTTHRLVFSRIFSSSFQRWPSRDTHQTSRVPSSVTRVSSRTGTIFPTWPSSFRVTCSGLRSSISSPQSSKRLPTWSCLRTLELRKRNSAGSPTTSPNSLSGIVASAPTVTSRRLIARATGNGLLQVGSFQDLHLPVRLKSLLSQPAVHPFHYAVAQHRRIPHSAAEQDMRATGESAAAAADARCLGTV